MSEKFKNKYRIESARLKFFNYAENGIYFITICTFDREYCFGNVLNEKIQLSNTGKIANQYWHNIPAHFPFVELDEYIVMPNHVHGIVIINRPSVETRHGASKTATETRDRASLHDEQQNKFGPLKRNSLQLIINAYKSSVTRFCNKNNLNFQWQSRYWDHIIRDEKSLNNIREYIRNNPLKWKQDRNNFKNLYM